MRKSHVVHKLRKMNLASMMDVCFLLLMFFLLTSSFTPDEGVLAQPMIGINDGSPPPMEVGPEVILKNNGVGGVEILVLGDIRPIGGFRELYDRLLRLKQDVYIGNSPLLIDARSDVAWDHVINALTQARRAKFAPRIGRPS